MLYTFVPERLCMRMLLYKGTGRQTVSTIATVTALHARCKDSQVMQVSCLCMRAKIMISQHFSGCLRPTAHPERGVTIYPRQTAFV